MYACTPCTDDPLMRSAFLAGFSVEHGILLGHLAAVALRAFDLTPVMFGHAEYDREVLLAFLTLVLISRHGTLLALKSDDYSL